MELDAAAPKASPSHLPQGSPQPSCPSTHIFVLVGVLGLGRVRDGGVTVGAVVLAVIVGCSGVRHDQELLDVTLRGRKHSVRVCTEPAGKRMKHHRETKSTSPGAGLLPQLLVNLNTFFFPTPSPCLIKEISSSPAPASPQFSTCSSGRCREIRSTPDNQKK